MLESLEKFKKQKANRANITTSVILDSIDKQKCKDYGLNISKICREAIKDKITLYEQETKSSYSSINLFKENHS